MKGLQLVLVFAIFGYCFTEDICSQNFEAKVKAACEAIEPTCIFTDYYPRCISKTNNDCSTGLWDRATCNRIFPSQFPLKKCVYDSSTGECNLEDSVCLDFNNGVNGVFFNNDKDICEKLKADNDRSSCRFDENEGKCKSF